MIYYYSCRFSSKEQAPDESTPLLSREGTPTRIVTPPPREKTPLEEQAPPDNGDGVSPSRKSQEEADYPVTPPKSRPLSIRAQRFAMRAVYLFAP